MGKCCSSLHKAQPPLTLCAPFQTGMVFVFNLIVGTGALTLPSVFSRAGWLLGSLIVLLLAFISYITLTFIIEASSCANALANYRNRSKQTPATSGEDDHELVDKEEGNEEENETTLRSASETEIEYSAREHAAAAAAIEDDQETTPLFQHERQRSSGYSLDTKYELSELAGFFFRPLGRLLFYLCMCIYLYGDLSIYNAAVAKSLTDVVCGNGTSNYSSPNGTQWEEMCWQGMPRTSFYRLSMIAFVFLLGPFVFFNLTKTKPLQILTAVFRWVAFLIMILLACMRFERDEADGQPPAGDWVQVPNLFGACIYSFMCHHSLPSLVAPIRQKERLKVALGMDYVGIAFFYLLLALTGAFAFRNLQDLYTLNFVPEGANVALKMVEYFLALFPVFTLSASYPIIGITLRNNLQILLRDLIPLSGTSSWWRRALFPVLAVLPPLLVTLNTENINGLVRFTGSYAGAGIQYLIPVALIYAGRRKAGAVLGTHLANRYQSPFRHGAWLVGVLLWTVVCVCLVTFTFVMGRGG